MSKIYVDEILPKDNATVDGSKLSGLISSALPTGSVLQVVQSYNDTNRDQIGATSWTATSFSASITPSSTSSKILATIDFGINDNTTSDVICVTSIFRGSTNLGNSTYGLAKHRSTTSRIEGKYTITYLDSPSTTSSTTYTLYLKNISGGGTMEVPGTIGVPTVVTLMEIAG